MDIVRLIFLLSFIYFSSCSQENTTEQSIDAYRLTQTITYNNINVDVVIDKPALNEVDVLLVFHGTVSVSYTHLTLPTTPYV